MSNGLCFIHGSKSWELCYRNAASLLAHTTQRNIMSTCFIPMKSLHFFASAIGRLPSLPRVTFLNRNLSKNLRLMASSKEPVFDEEMSLLYAKMADNHRHPNGPWPLMTDFAVKAANSSTSPCFRVLDLASGPGEPAKSIATALPQAVVYATDISEPMVVIASKITLPNFHASLADMQNLSSFESNYFDAVTCCYGYMFPSDKDSALKETLRVLKPGGRLVASTWDKLPILELANEIMKGVLGFQPPPPPLNPMSLSAPGLFQSMLENNGFTEIVSYQSTYPFDLGDDSEFQFKMSTLLLKDKLTELNEWPKAKSVYLDVIDKYAMIDSSGHMTVEGNTFKVTTAIKPHLRSD